MVDVGDAMGANIVNTMVEAIAPDVAALSGGEARLCILSNLADRRLARASVRIPFEVLRTDALDGAEVARRVVEAWALAAADPYRAATHNKGVMNGIDAVAHRDRQRLARHRGRARTPGRRAHGRYGPLTTWSLDGDALRGDDRAAARGRHGGRAPRAQPARAARRCASSAPSRRATWRR